MFLRQTGRAASMFGQMMKEQLGKGGPKLFTPWMALHDQELAEEE